ncbi:MAG TPA: FecR family protein, partial [Gammaproteobacteria bacterium]|nr:FecR family protein [Gammaproteobacteria bacterium]
MNPLTSLKLAAAYYLAEQAPGSTIGEETGCGREALRNGGREPMQMKAQARALLSTFGYGSIFGVLMCGSAALGSGAGLAPEGGPSPIYVTDLAGKVVVTAAGASRRVHVDDVLGLPARIVTGDDGRIDLRQSKTSVSIAPDSDIEIPQDARSGHLIAKLIQRKGDVFYDVEPRPLHKLRIETPYLVAVVKGTQFNVIVQPDSTTISLFRGLLDIRTPDNGQVIALRAGQIAIRSISDGAIRVLNMNQAAPPAAPAARPDGAAARGDRAAPAASAGAGAQAAGRSPAAHSGSVSASDFAREGSARGDTSTFNPVAAARSNPAAGNAVAAANAQLRARGAIVTDLELSPGSAAVLRGANPHENFGMTARGLGLPSAGHGAASIDAGGGAVNVGRGAGAAPDVGIGANLGFDTGAGNGASTGLGISGGLALGNGTASTGGGADSKAGSNSGTSVDAGLHAAGAGADVGIGRGGVHITVGGLHLGGGGADKSESTGPETAIGAAATDTGTAGTVTTGPGRSA